MREEAMRLALQSLEVEATAIADIAGYLNEQAFSAAVDAICSSGKIIACASGSSGIAAKKLSHSLCCINRPSFFMYPSEAVHGGLGAVCPGDTVIIVSRGGKTTELLPIIRVCKERGARLVGVTENMDSPLAKSSDIVLRMRISRESDPCNIMATSSFIMTVALFDALLAAVMVESGYKLEHFAQIHPGGAVGEMLNK